MYPPVDESRVELTKRALAGVCGACWPNFAGTEMSASFGARTAPLCTSTGSPGRSMIVESLIGSSGVTATGLVAAGVGGVGWGLGGANRQAMRPAQTQAIRIATASPATPLRPLM